MTYGVPLHLFWPHPLLSAAHYYGCHEEAQRLGHRLYRRASGRFGVGGYWLDLCWILVGSLLNTGDIVLVRFMETRMKETQAETHKCLQECSPQSVKERGKKCLPCCGAEAVVQLSTSQ